MANYKINIPNSDSGKPLHIKKKADSITVTNIDTSTLQFWFDDQTEFIDANGQYIGTRTMNPGDSFTATAQKAEQVHYSYMDHADSELAQPHQAGVRTIVVGSTTSILETFREIFEKDTHFRALFGECWPCTERLLNALVKLSAIPDSDEGFLNELIVAGHKAYANLYPKK